MYLQRLFWTATVFNFQSVSHCWCTVFLRSSTIIKKPSNNVSCYGFPPLAFRFSLVSILLWYSHANLSIFTLFSFLFAIYRAIINKVGTRTTGQYTAQYNARYTIMNTRWKEDIKFLLFWGKLLYDQPFITLLLRQNFTISYHYKWTKVIYWII